MTFLAPSVLWGLLAASIPIIIHLISLSRTREVEFSTLRFIKELEHETIRRLKLRQWLLVLLRVLIIICLVLMVARPFQRGFVPGWMAGEQESRIVIIVDNSASMALKTNRTTLLDHAKNSVLQIVNSFEGLATIEVFQTNPLKRVFKGKLGEEALISSVAAIQQTMSTDHLWVVVDSVLKSLEVSEPNRECFLLSDFSRGSYLQFLQENEFLVSKELNDTTQFAWKFYCLGQEEVKDNLSIRNVSAVSQIRLPNHLLKLKTRITNEGTLEKRNNPVELYLNEERLGQVVSSFQPAQTKEFMFQTYPGKSGLIKGRVELPKDDFELDNRWTFELPIPEQISCTIIGGSVEEIYLLEMGLSSIDDQANFLVLDSRADPRPKRLFLDETDVLILHNPGNLSVKAIEDVQSFLSRGGGIIWFAGDRQVNEENQSLEAALKLPASFKLHKLEGEAYYSVSSANEGHPVLVDLNLRNLNSELPQVFEYVETNLRKNHTTILKLNNGHPFLIEFPSNGGKIFYFTSLMDLNWNDLPMRGLMVPLLHRILLLLATDESNTKPVFVDEPKIITLDEEKINSQWSLITPSGKSILLIPDFNTETLRINQTNELGSYNVLTNGYHYASFSTLLSPYEYPADRVEKANILELLPQGHARWIGPTSDLTAELENIRHGKSLWRTFLILAILFLLLESILGHPKPEAIKRKDSL